MFMSARIHRSNARESQPALDSSVGFACARKDQAFHPPLKFQETAAHAPVTDR
jgi:hypothetical protein